MSEVERVSGREAEPGSGRVTERVCTFGQSGSLTGVVTLPPGDDGARGGGAGPFVILLNAGLVHRIGPFRMTVDLARRLARGGLRVLRFDASGIGDSAARARTVNASDNGSAFRGGVAPVEERAVSEGREAMEFLAETYGATSFAAGGLCTGAMNAHRLGVADPRVTALFLLDGYAYPTWTSRRRKVTGILGDPACWPATARHLAAQGRERARALLGRGGAESGSPERDARTELFFQDWPPVPEVRKELERMLLRGTRILFVYTGGWCDFVAAEQFDEMFPRLTARERVTVEYHARADHTFFTVADREAMLRSVERFLTGGAAS